MNVRDRFILSQKYRVRFHIMFVDCPKGIMESCVGIYLFTWIAILYDDYKLQLNTRRRITYSKFMPNLVKKNFQLEGPEPLYCVCLSVTTAVSGVSVADEQQKNKFGPRYSVRLQSFKLSLLSSGREHSWNNIFRQTLPEHKKN